MTDVVSLQKTELEKRAPYVEMFNDEITWDEYHRLFDSLTGMGQNVIICDDMVPRCFRRALNMVHRGVYSAPQCFRTVTVFIPDQYVDWKWAKRRSSHVWPGFSCQRCVDFVNTRLKKPLKVGEFQPAMDALILTYTAKIEQKLIDNGSKVF